MLMKKIFALLLAILGIQLGVLAQNKTVSGRVMDATGNGIPSASVIVPNSSIGTTADQNGNFSISVPARTTHLNISAVNYGSTRVAIGANNVANATLSLAGDPLEGVVVTGIRTIRRTEYAGAVSRMDSTALSEKTFGSFDQALQGQTPGISVLSSSGQPGTSANIVIRGSNSISGGTDPLYVVDGITVEPGVFQGINANDIATIDILKDAASTALYGSRGSGGVIVVTTKRGKAGKLKLGYSVQYGQKSRPDFAFRPMNTTEILEAQRLYGSAFNNADPGGSINNNTNIPGWYYNANNPRVQALSAAGQATAANLLDSIGRINTNWYDQFFRTGTFSQHNLTLSGGEGKLRTYSNLELFNEDGITQRSDMRRISLRNNVDYNDTKLTFSLSSNIAYIKRNFQESTTTNSTRNPFLATNITVPYASLYKPDGYSYATGVGAKYVGANALDLIRYNESLNDQVKVTLGTTAEYKIIPELSAGITAGVDFRETQNTFYSSRLAFLSYNSTTPTTNQGGLTEGLNRFFTFNVRPSLNYRKRFNNIHLVDVGVYGEMVKEYFKSLSMTGYGIDPRLPNTPAAITQGNSANQLYANVGGGKTQNALLSGLLMATYNYDNRYTLSGSYRKDGSSKLPKATRWADFYSIAGIWTISNEAFMKDNNFINSLRLRGSYGSSGNSNNFPQGDFGYLPTYGTGSYYGLETIIATSIGNPNLTWETTYQANVGTDFTFWNNRVFGSVDVYKRTTKDLFVTKPLAWEAGGGSIEVNAGELENKGIETNLSVDVVKTPKFTWTLNGNFNYNKNEIIDLGGEQSYEWGTSLISIGLPLGSHYEVEWAGVDQATGAPLYYTKDGQLTTVYSTDNAVQKFGTSEAPWKGGFGTRLQFSGFELSALFTWQQGNTKVDNLEYFVENPVGFLAGGYNQSADLKFWTKPGDVVNVPSPLYAQNFSSKIIHDASFVRFRDLTLAYNFTDEVLKRSKVISSARVFITGQNLWIWTKWRGMDPEAGASNINLSEFPNPRSITGGIQLRF